MFWCLFLLLACFDAFTKGENPLQEDGRIVGGLPVTIQEYPYQISLEDEGGHSCGGVIISKDYVLTAAHCTDGKEPSSLTVRAGTTFKEKGGKVVGVGEIHQHPKYVSSTMDYDISVLALNESLEFGGPSVAPIGLAPADFKFPENASLVVTGWGTIVEGAFKIPEQLHMVRVPYVDNAHCARAYSGRVITDRMICAGRMRGGKDSCQGDSGGPLAGDGVLVGIVSWGHGCARPEYPGVYASISNLRDYIKSVTRL